MAEMQDPAKQHVKETITWTRFHLPLNQQWPAWPSSGKGHPAEQYVGPLADMEGAPWNKITLGKMVEFPEEAVYMVQWETMDDLHKFLASPACDRFLKHLSEHGHEHRDETSPTTAAEDKDAETKSARRKVGSLTVEEEKSSSSATEPEIDLSHRRRRFLILTHFEGRQTTDIEGRVTLSVFVLPVPRKDENNSLWTAYQRLGATFGYRQLVPSRDEEEPIERYWCRPKVWFYAEKEQEDLSERWIERTFGGSSGVNQTGSSSGPKTLVCEFRVWHENWRVKDNRYVEMEEAQARDEVFRKKWEQVTGEWMARGRILAWKSERWDFRRVPFPLHFDGMDEDGEDEEEEEEEVEKGE